MSVYACTQFASHTLLSGKMLFPTKLKTFSYSSFSYCLKNLSRSCLLKHKFYFTENSFLKSFVFSTWQNIYDVDNILETGIKHYICLFIPFICKNVYFYEIKILSLLLLLFGTKTKVIISVLLKAFFSDIRYELFLTINAV